MMVKKLIKLVKLRKLTLINSFIVFTTFNKVRLIFLFLLLSSVSSAQPPAVYTSKNKKAIKHFENARQHYTNLQEQYAIPELQKALEEDPLFIEAHMMLANIAEDVRQYNKAVDHYKKAVAISPDFFPNNYYALARSEMRIGQYEEAKAHLEKFLSMPKISEGLKKPALRMLKNCEFASVAIKNPVPFKPVNMGGSINSTYDEYFPAITADGNTFLFTRNLSRTDRTGMTIAQEDFHISKKSEGKWQPAVNLGAPVNSEGNEGAPSLGADGQMLFFTACMEMYGYPGDRKGFGSCDIFASRLVGTQWVHAANLGPGVNTTFWESQPSFSSDGKTLYFVRGTISKSGREKEQDIYTSQLLGDGKWSPAIKISDKINTPGKEESVFIHPDNQTLYFSSDGHPGMGGLDIFVARRQADGTWGEPVNLGYPINTSEDESSLLVGPNGNVAYFSSTREGGFGGEDLYEFELYEKARPAKITYVKGKVFDSKTKNPLDASFEMIDLETGLVVVQSQANKGNGEFLICLPAGKNYALNASRTGYLFYSENFSLKEHSENLKTYSLDVPLQPIESGARVPLRNVFFDTDKFDLKEQSKAELNKLVAFLNANPKVKIELSGHTDNTGDKKKNSTLSHNRAKAVYDFILQSGITADRLTFKGFGDSMPVESNATEEGRAKNRRTEFSVIGN